MYLLFSKAGWKLLGLSSRHLSLGFLVTVVWTFGITQNLQAQTIIIIDVGDIVHVPIMNQGENEVFYASLDAPVLFKGKFPVSSFTAHDQTNEAASLFNNVVNVEVCDPVFLVTIYDQSNASVFSSTQTGTFTEHLANGSYTVVTQTAQGTETQSFQVNN